MRKRNPMASRVKHLWSQTLRRIDLHTDRTSARPTRLRLLVVTAAVAAVAAFDAVGSIIVIAMFICPPAAARLMTNRLEHQVWWSVGFATLSAVLGYVFAG